jgi:hypothetical protein
MHCFLSGHTDRGLSVWLIQWASHHFVIYYARCFTCRKLQGLCSGVGLYFHWLKLEILIVTGTTCMVVPPNVILYETHVVVHFKSSPVPRQVLRYVVIKNQSSKFTCNPLQLLWELYKVVNNVTICNISFVFLCLPKSLIRSYLLLISISTFRRLHSHPLSLLLLDICSILSSLCFTLTFPSYYPYLWHLSTLTDTPTYCRHSIDYHYVLPSLT